MAPPSRTPSARGAMAASSAALLLLLLAQQAEEEGEGRMGYEEEDEEGEEEEEEEEEEAPPPEGRRTPLLPPPCPQAAAMMCGTGGLPPCPGGGGGGPPGKDDPFRDELRDGLPEGGEEEEEALLFEGEDDAELEWLPHEMGKRVARIWLKTRGAGNCMHCGHDKFVHLCLSNQCQRRNMGIHNTHMAIAARPQARNRMAKGVAQREFPGIEK